MSALRHAMILAAGFGTRMGHLTKDRPKPLLDVAGRTLLDRTLDHAAEAMIREAVVNLHYRGDMIRGHLAGREQPTLRFSEELPDILDTGGGVVRALPLLGEGPFAVMNSDSIWAGPNPIAELARLWDPSRMDTLLLLVPIERTEAYTRVGDFFLSNDGEAPIRRGDAAMAPYVYSGAHITRPEAFRDAPAGAFSLNLVWDRQLAAGRLSVAVYPGRWVDVGTPDGLDAARRLFVSARSAG